MKTVKISIDPNNSATLAKGRIDLERYTTTEQDIAAHQHIDETMALLDAAQFARWVRKRLGLS